VTNAVIIVEKLAKAHLINSIFSWGNPHPVSTLELYVFAIVFLSYFYEPVKCLSCC